MKKILHIPRDAVVVEEYLCESSEDAQRIAQQWAQDLADDKQETVGCYYEVLTLSRDVDSPKEIDEDERYGVIEEYYVEATPADGGGVQSGQAPHLDDTGLSAGDNVSREM